ncbi:hypothetical protein J3F83DRAFT_230791 [Trichoderma novae-zelandiae]
MEKLERRPMMASAGGLEGGDGVAIMLFPISCFQSLHLSASLLFLALFPPLHPHPLLSSCVSVRQSKKTRRALTLLVRYGEARPTWKWEGNRGKWVDGWMDGWMVDSSWVGGRGLWHRKPKKTRRDTQACSAGVLRRMLAGGGCQRVRTSEEKRETEGEGSIKRGPNRKLSSAIQNVAEDPIAAADAECVGTGLMLLFLLVPSQHSEPSKRCWR